MTAPGTLNCDPGPEKEFGKSATATCKYKSGTYKQLGNNLMCKNASQKQIVGCTAACCKAAGSAAASCLQVRWLEGCWLRGCRRHERLLAADCKQRWWLQVWWLPGHIRLPAPVAKHRRRLPTHFESNPSYQNSTFFCLKIMCPTENSKINSKCLVRTRNEPLLRQK